MAHGQPDFSATSPKKTVYSLSDMAELAARLGSIVTLDRRGDIVWIEDFSHSLVNWASEAPLGTPAAIVTTRTLTSGYSVKLEADTPGAAYARITRYSPLPVNTHMGIEFAFMIESQVDYVDLLLAIYDGLVTNEIAARVDRTLSLIQYENDAFGWGTLGTKKLLHNDPCWHHIKLVFDIEARQYMRMIVDNTEYDMAGIPFNSLAAVGSPQSLSTKIQISAVGSVSEPIGYIANVICTQNEP